MLKGPVLGTWNLVRCLKLLLQATELLTSSLKVSPDTSFLFLYPPRARGRRWGQERKWTNKSTASLSRSTTTGRYSTRTTAIHPSISHTILSGHSTFPVGEVSVYIIVQWQLLYCRDRSKYFHRCLYVCEQILSITSQLVDFVHPSFAAKRDTVTTKSIILSTWTQMSRFFLIFGTNLILEHISASTSNAICKDA